MAASYRQTSGDNKTFGESSFALGHVLCKQKYFKKKKAIDSSGHFTWMSNYSEQDFCDILFCEVLCLLLYSACGTGYSNWFCLYKHLKYYIFIKMFIFNDIRKLLLGRENTAL